MKPPSDRKNLVGAILLGSLALLGVIALMILDKVVIPHDNSHAVTIV